MKIGADWQNNAKHISPYAVDLEKNIVQSRKNSNSGERSSSVMRGGENSISKEFKIQ